MAENIHTQAKYVIWVFNSDRERIGVIENYSSLNFSRAFGSVGKFSFVLPATSDDVQLLSPDCVMQVWRTIPGDVSYLEFGGFMDVFQYREEGGKEILRVGGSDGLSILKRRIHWYDPSLAQSNRNEPISSFYYNVIQNNFDFSAPFNERDLSDHGFDFQAATLAAIGSNIAYSFAFKNVLDIVNYISDVSTQKGIPAFFDVVPQIKNNLAGWIFKWSVYQLGLDRINTANPTVFSKALGNLENPDLTFDYSEEKNAILVGGEGEQEYKTYTEYLDSARRYRTSYSRKEMYAEHLSQNTDASRDDLGNRLLQAGKPKIKFTGNIKDTPQTRYGKDWGYGDKISINHANYVLEGMVSAIAVNINEGGAETITARVEEQLT